jgi:hypothetical protein
MLTTSDPRLKVTALPWWASVLTTSFVGLKSRHFEEWILG